MVIIILKSYLPLSLAAVTSDVVGIDAVDDFGVGSSTVMLIVLDGEGAVAVVIVTTVVVTIVGVVVAVLSYA